MKIVILGAGRIGGSLARNLSNSNYEVCVVDENKNRLLELEDRLDIMTVEGSASHLKTLKKCGIVKSRDEGKKAMYSITSKQLAELITNVTNTSKEIPNLCVDEKCC